MSSHWIALLLFYQSLVSSANQVVGVRRIRSTETANHTEFLPCLNELPPSLRPFAQEYRKTTRDPPYTSLSCAPQRCFRAVWDGYESWITNDDNLLFLEELADRVANLLERFFVPPPLQSSSRRKQTVSGRSVLNNLDRPLGQFHVDYFEVADYVVTGIVYSLGIIPEHLQGGETGFADVIDDTGQLKEGLVVEPKPGRVVLFSGGGENFHGPLPIQRPDQARPAFVFFFKCRGSDPEERKDFGEKKDEL